MPDKWTGELIGDIHNAGFRIRDVAAEAQLNPKYVSQLLHGRAVSQKAEAKLREALYRLKATAEQEYRRDEQEDDGTDT